MRREGCWICLLNNKKGTTTKKVLRWIEKFSDLQQSSSIQILKSATAIEKLFILLIKFKNFNKTDIILEHCSRIKNCKLNWKIIDLFYRIHICINVSNEMIMKSKRKDLLKINYFSSFIWVWKWSFNR